MVKPLPSIQELTSTKNIVIENAQRSITAKLSDTQKVPNGIGAPEAQKQRKSKSINSQQRMQSLQDLGKR